MMTGERPINVDELVNMTSKLGVDHEEEWEENEDAALAFGAKSLEKLVRATFKSIEDAKSVLGKQPWVFNGGLLILEKWPLSGNWGDARLDKVLCWVKVKGLPIKLFTKKNVTRLGEMAGEVVEIRWGDENRMFSNGYVRMRIGFPLNTSIFVGRFIPCGGKKHWIHFKFEHLPMLCFNCGIWGHEQKDCAGGMRRETDDAGNLVPKYGSWLKDDDPCPNGFVSAGIVNSASPIDNGRHWGQERSSGNEGVVHGGPANHGGECTAEGGEQTVIRGVEEGVTKILEGAVNVQMDIMGHTLHVEPKEVKATTVGPSLKASIGREIKGPECGIGPTMSNTHPCMDPTVASGSVHSTLPDVTIAEHDKKKRKNGEATVAIDSEEIQRLRSKGKQVQQASVGVDGNENFAIGVSTGETRGLASTSGQRKRVSIKTRARLAKSNGNSRGHSKSVLEESKAQVGVPGGVFSVVESHTGGNHGGLGLGEKEGGTCSGLGCVVQDLAGAVRFNLQAKPISSLKVVWRKDVKLDHAIEKDKHFKLCSRVVREVLNEPGQVIPLRYLEKRRERLRLNIKARTFLTNYPGLFDVYYDRIKPKTAPVQFLRVSNKLKLFLEEEERIITKNEPLIVSKLCKLLMMSKDRVLSADKLVHVKREFGFPNDFLVNLVPKYSQYFRLVGSPGEGKSFLELVSWNPEFAKSVIEQRSEEESRVTGIRPRPNFYYKLPSGFFLRKEMREWVRDWMELDYVSPYDEISHLGQASQEMEKRTVGVFHELLSLSIHKRIPVPILGKFGDEYRFSNAFSSVFTRHSGIFYMSLKGGIKTAVLREAYKGDELIDRDPLLEIKDKFVELLEEGRQERAEQLRLQREEIEKDMEVTAIRIEE
uniref:CCHC-type domain-containing protein n=1 Tax=Cannabis sativa TaxID=3483 RepID=A0A803QEB6_CANSA